MKATFKIWRTHQGTTDGTFQTFHTEVSEGMVVLDAVHRIQAEEAPDLLHEAVLGGSAPLGAVGSMRLLGLRTSRTPPHRPTRGDPTR